MKDMDDGWEVCMRGMYERSNVRNCFSIVPWFDFDLIEYSYGERQKPTLPVHATTTPEFITSKISNTMILLVKYTKLFEKLPTSSDAFFFSLTSSSCLNMNEPYLIRCFWLWVCPVLRSKPPMPAISFLKFTQLDIPPNFLKYFIPFHRSRPGVPLLKKGTNEDK